MAAVVGAVAAAAGAGVPGGGEPGVGEVPAVVAVVAVVLGVEVEVDALTWSWNREGGPATAVSGGTPTTRSAFCMIPANAGAATSPP